MPPTQHPAEDHIAHRLAAGATRSFEFFPPKTDAGMEKLARTVATLAELDPDFVSITYGAGGSTRDHTRDLVVAYTLRSVFSSDGRLAKTMMQAAWKHSCRIAALSYIIARDVARLNPERALLAGLLHDIGITVLIAQCENHPAIMNDEANFCRIVHELSAQVGAMILRTWRFPDVFVRAIFEAEEFNKPVRDRLDLSDTVMLAHLHDSDPAPWSGASADFSELAIAEKLKDHAISDNDRLAIVEEAQQELRELTLLLNG